MTLDNERKNFRIAVKCYFEVKFCMKNKKSCLFQTAF